MKKGLLAWDINRQTDAERRSETKTKLINPLCRGRPSSCAAQALDEGVWCMVYQKERKGEAEKERKTKRREKEGGRYGHAQNNGQHEQHNFPASYEL